MHAANLCAGGGPRASFRAVLLLAALAGLFILPTPWNVIGVAVAAVIEVGEVYLWRRYLRRFRVQGGAEGMVGERVEVIERCDPRGRVKVRGEIWTADAVRPPIEVGERAAVASVEGLILRVEAPTGADTERAPVRGPAP